MSDTTTTTDDLGVPPAVLPRADGPIAAMATTPPHAPEVVADIATDNAGEPRSEEPGTPPPGTTEERWWERSAFKMLCGGIALIWLPLLRAWIAATLVSREALADATTDSIDAILLWAGVTTVTRGGLRRK